MGYVLHSNLHRPLLPVTDFTMSNNFVSPSSQPIPMPQTTGQGTTPPGTPPFQAAVMASNNSTSAPSAQSLSTTMNNITLLIDAITVDRLASDFKLTAGHRANLHAFVRVRSSL